MRVRALSVLAVLLPLVLAGTGLEAAGWPEIPESERKLTEMPGMPNAPAVMLLSRGELFFDDRAVSSYFEIYQRIKILNEEGRKYGTVDIPTTSFFRVKSVEGRTLLPDGRIVELGKDAQFEKKYSSFYDYSVNSFALPAVEVGAIVEYRYRQYFDSVVFSEPWYFASELPTLRSEIECNYPRSFGFAPVKFSPFGREIKESSENTPATHRVVYWMENVPPVPDEPARYPFSDLSPWALFIPQEYVFNGRLEMLLKSWPDAVEVVQGARNYGYRGARSKDGSAKRKAKELAAGATTDQARAETVYRFVRDEIRTADWYGVGIGDRTCDKTLKDGRGDYADKAILLQSMLKGVGVDSSLGWVRPRSRGRTQVNLPVYHQFDKVLVVADLEGKRVFLDPSDPALPFGVLPPNLEGIPCLLVDEKKPEFVDTPGRPAEDNRRAARLELAVSEEGVLSGSGKLRFEGHHAWRAKRWTRAADDVEKFWQEWLEGRFPGYDVSAVEVQDTPEALQMELAWSLAQRPEEALGDEVSLTTAAPLSLTSNPFSLPPGRRLTPVMLDFADVDRVELALTWPEGWELEGKPKLAGVSNGAGQLKVALEVDDAARKLELERSFAVAESQFVGTPAYAALHDLYNKAAASDAESIILVRQ